MVTEKDFRRAIEQVDFRQEFLDSIDLEYVCQYVERVNYVPLIESKLTEKIIENILTETLMSISHSAGTKSDIVGMRHTIDVFDKSFSGLYLACLGDFLNVLIDHEGWHAKEYFENPSIIIYQQEVDQRYFLEDGIFEYNIELRAYENQLAKIEGRKCSPEYIRSIERRFDHVKQMIGTNQEVQKARLSGVEN